MADLYGTPPKIPSRRMSMLGLGLPGNTQGKIDDGVRRTVGMPPKKYRLPGLMDNPPIGKPIYGPQEMMPAGGAPGMGLFHPAPPTGPHPLLHQISNPVAPQAMPQPPASQPSGVFGVREPGMFNGPEINAYNAPQPSLRQQMPASVGQVSAPAQPVSPNAADQRLMNDIEAQHQDFRKRVASAWRFSPDDSSQGAQGLNPTPRSAMYPAHPYANKFPIQHNDAPVVEPSDNGMTQDDYKLALEGKRLLPNANMRNGRSDPVYRQQQIDRRNAQAANEARDFEKQKLALQRRNELRQLSGPRRDMGESWIQSQFRQENPALFARGVNSDMLKYSAAMNARQRMDAPNLGGYSPQDAQLLRQKMYFDNAAGMNDAQRAEARQMLGLQPPQGAHSSGVYPAYAGGQSKGNWLHPLNPLSSVWRFLFGG